MPLRLASSSHQACVLHKIGAFVRSFMTVGVKMTSPSIPFWFGKDPAGGTHQQTNRCQGRRERRVIWFAVALSGPPLDRQHHHPHWSPSWLSSINISTNTLSRVICAETRPLLSRCFPHFSRRSALIGRRRAMIVSVAFKVIQIDKIWFFDTIQTQTTAT